MSRLPAFLHVMQAIFVALVLACVFSCTKQSQDPSSAEKETQQKTEVKTGTKTEAKTEGRQEEPAPEETKGEDSAKSELDELMASAEKEAAQAKKAVEEKAAETSEKATGTLQAIVKEAEDRAEKAEETTEKATETSEKATGTLQSIVKEAEDRAEKAEETTEKATETAEKAAETAASKDPTLVPTVVWLPEPIECPDSQAKTEKEMKKYTETIPDTQVKFEMVPIPGGTFTMGSPADEKSREACEGPRFKAEIAPFWMGKCEVTWEEYSLWMELYDSAAKRTKKSGENKTPHQKLADAISCPTPPYSDMTFGMGREGYPALCMTQLAAMVYCKWLSAKTGRYYRLPTEAEWEYACRAGSTTPYYFGADSSKLPEYAWFLDNSSGKYHKIGQKKPNAWGLYDMHGNVAEWVIGFGLEDGYKKFEGKTVKSPIIAATEIYGRPVRGGSWLDEAQWIRVASRTFSDPSWKEQDPQIPKSIWYHTDADFIGFRLVRPLTLPSKKDAARYNVDEVQKAAYLEYKEFKGL